MAGKREWILLMNCSTTNIVLILEDLFLDEVGKHWISMLFFMQNVSITCIFLFGLFSTSYENKIIINININHSCNLPTYVDILSTPGFITLL